MRVLLWDARRYKLKDTSDSILLEAHSTFECSSESNALNAQGLDLCNSFGLKQGNKFSCVAKDQNCIQIHIKETAHFFDVSPAMIFFLGLIPSTQYYYYEVEVTQTGQSGTEQSVIEEFEIVESWGTLNSIKRLFGSLNSKENEQTKIGSFIRAKYGLRT